ncbi:MAG: hypothetical protein CSA19_00095 [Deltaproteobacteria bacterium]|nr:MAG: hypothetical protein CSA19_00095 [Deltaproteobacteria bacterium]
MFKSLRWKLVFIAEAMVLITTISLLFTITRIMEKTEEKKHQVQVSQQAASRINLIESDYDGFRHDIIMFSDSQLFKNVDDSVQTYTKAQNVKIKSSDIGGHEPRVYESFKEFDQSHPGITFTYFGTRYGGYLLPRRRDSVKL